MSKQIIIAGGGISGLSLLHYLKQKYSQRPDVQILLLEKEDSPGGTIESVERNGCLFETGPNGFLDSKPRTLDFARELELEREIVRADEQAKIRYISLNHALYALPAGPRDFFAFKPLSIFDKMRVLCELLIPKGSHPHESVYAFGKRRLGEKFAQIFLDPMISGIYGGDARQINLKAAFPRMYQLEEEYGSLFKAMMRLKRDKKKGKAGPSGGMPTGTLTSFSKGQSRLIQVLAERYKEDIVLNQEVRTVSVNQGRFVLYSEDKHYEADELFLSVPSYCAAKIVKGISPSLAEDLDRVYYAPIAVIGLVFPVSVFKDRPKGFGYVIPSLEKKEVLGVLFESNIFPGRCPDDKILFRVMIGGARHPDILEKDEGELARLAADEIRKTFKTEAEPLETFFKSWFKAIPQYNGDYFAIQNNIDEKLTSWRHLHLVANYRGGVSLNDCIENAYQAAQNISLSL